ncbi:MAG: type VI secretion system baseplate subunit TssG, partial [Myxococcales bacterium]|nr:type VI secretion system baseplate subunit TssG [Myxococcales bacterium]
MGSQERQPDAALSAAERSEAERQGALAVYGSSARRFDFYRLLYLLERLYPDSPRLGHTGPARDERIRLRADPSLVFSPSDVSSLVSRRFPDAHDRVEITAAFLGLYGATSPLPPYFVEKVARSVYQGGPQPVRELLDVVHHRVFALAYRAWAKYRHSVGYLSGGVDKFTQRMFCAVGVDGFRKATTPLNPFYLLRFAPLIATKSRSSRGLEVVMRELFGEIPVAIDQFVGCWTLIEQPLRNQLGVSNHELGE